MIEIIAFTALCLFLYNLWGWLFAKSCFWTSLYKEYPCSRSEFREVKSMGRDSGRFVYSCAGFWKSNDYIDVKIAGGYLYMGVDLPISFSVPSIKIPSNQLEKLGVRRHYLSKRDVFSICFSNGEVNSGIFQVALLPELSVFLD